ncbi:RDD family protein [Mucilaginibacter agri]|uniref:RDD family protein n=1 Tax=Mucilaginibacter agri TaxID=2695265 RepID=A0A965ZDC7_9SPHI|nr:RDD family protein [Mucilaginibacter agri]NCD68973.1 RDD family protein [Mucilaginibacter agri]
MLDDLLTAGAEPNAITLEYPALVERLQSVFIDMMLIIMCMGIFSALLDRLTFAPVWVRPTLFFTLFFIYEPVCICYGCTLGNYIKKIRVRNVDDINEPINLLQSFIRYTLKLALGWFSFLTIHGTPQRRAIHDIASGSLMIKKA